MKKNFKFMLVALLAFVGSMAYAVAPQQGTNWTDDKFTYTVVDPQALTVSIAPNGSLEGPVTIEPTVTKKFGDDTYTFTIATIANQAFKDQIGITQVTFSKEITSIGDQAFQGCTLLAAIAFESGSKLVNLGIYAFAETQIVSPDFSNCTKLPGLPEYLFTLGEGKTNSYVKNITLPTSVAFKTISTSLAGLVNLETENIKDTKINIVKANAFAKTSSKVEATDKGLRALELPNTVKTIEANAFQNSLIASLTINVDGILDDATLAIGNNAASVYGTSTTVLTSLTLKGELSGKVSTNAFKGCTKLAKVDMSEMTFASKGQIMTSAFEGCTGLTEVTVGTINHNGTTGEYTINDDAFKGCDKLTKVTIGDIDTQGAVGKEAFGKKLVNLEIGDVKKINAFKAGAFTFDPDADGKLDKTVVIGQVFNESPDGQSVVFPAGTIVMGDNAKSATITIGKNGTAIDSKGGVFAAGAITGKVTALIFNGNIKEKGLTKGDVDGTMVKILVNNGNVATLTFKGKIGEKGIGDFSGLKDGAVVTFEGELAPNSIVANSFLLTTAGETKLTVKYTATIEDASYNPFNQKAFAVEALANDGLRTVTMEISNGDLKELIKAGQISYALPEKANDIIYAVKLLAEEETDAFDVYQVGSTNVAYGRITLDKTKIFKFERRPKDKNITYTLYTTYVEEDEYLSDNSHKSGMTTLNMMPMLSVDGFYYVNPAALNLQRDLVVIIKATGSGVTSDLKLEYETLDAMPQNAQNAIMFTDERVMVADKILTNKMLRDDDNLEATTGVNISLADRAANDIYAITNPASHEGISADILAYKTSTKPFINTGMFYVLGKHYNNVKAARLVINWIGDEEATGIMEVKQGKKVVDEAIYTLQGVRVSAPVKGNIYIKNGKKFIMK